jgi:hypothetical protein
MLPPRRRLRRRRRPPSGRCGGRRSRRQPAGRRGARLVEHPVIGGAAPSAPRRAVADGARTKEGDGARTGSSERPPAGETEEAGGHHRRHDRAAAQRPALPAHARFHEVSLATGVLRRRGPKVPDPPGPSGQKPGFQIIARSGSSQTSRRQPNGMWRAAGPDELFVAEEGGAVVGFAWGLRSAHRRRGSHPDGATAECRAWDQGPCRGGTKGGMIRTRHC